MNIKDLLLVGVPECFVMLVFGILVIKGKENFKQIINIRSIFKLIISITLILFIIRTSRSSFNSIIIVTLMTTAIYILILNIIWKHSFIESIFGGFFIMAFMIITENYIFPVTANIFGGMFDIRFVITYPIRLIQIAITLIIYKFNINLSNNIFNKSKWKDLDLGKKAVILYLLIFIFISIIYNASTGDIFIKLKSNGFENIISLIKLNLNIYNYGSTVMFALIAYSLIRTSKYEDFKKILYRDPQELFNLMLKVSNNKQIESYRQQLTDYIKYESEGRKYNE